MWRKPRKLKSEKKNIHEVVKLVALVKLIILVKLVTSSGMSVETDLFYLYPRKNYEKTSAVILSEAHRCCGLRQFV